MKKHNLTKLINKSGNILSDVLQLIKTRNKLCKWESFTDMADEFNSLPLNIQAKMEQYRMKLLNFGMREPAKRDYISCHWCFYKPATELTAFVINLRGNDSSIEIYYGYASTAFTKMAGDENALLEWGVSDKNITIREKAVVFNETDEASVKYKIAEMYTAYQNVHKDSLLLYAKEKRKAFIQQIHIKLKTLGFRKKANTWTYALDNIYYLMFNAQKSAYSDEYYFNLYIGKNGTDDYGDCYYTRIAPNDMFPMDWQALSKENFNLFIDKTVVPEVKKIISTPLTELGQMSSYWKGCHCSRQKCECCWMEKNLWEDKS